MTTQAPPLLGVDHLELYVGNARQAAIFYRALGFEPVAYGGLETGVRDTASWCLESGGVRLILRSPLRAHGPVADWVRLHGDGVRSVGLAVPDAASAHEHALSHGARDAGAPVRHDSGDGAITVASISACGDVLHTFVTREGEPASPLPGLEPRPPAGNGRAAGASGLLGVDHVAIAVELGGLERQIEFYRDVLGFTEMDVAALKSVTTDHSALMSRVVEGGDGKVKFPIVEPAEGDRASQVDEFVEFFGGPGVQHIAIETADITATARAMRHGGIGFLDIRPEYYEQVSERVPEVAGEVDALREAGVLADMDDDGYLLQAFSQPLQDRPTLFLELIERHGSRGFGGGNVRALFEALELAQAARGNL